MKLLTLDCQIGVQPYSTTVHSVMATRLPLGEAIERIAKFKESQNDKEGRALFSYRLLNVTEIEELTPLQLRLAGILLVELMGEDEHAAGL